MRIIHRAGIRFCRTHEELYGLRAHSLKVQEVQSLRLALCAGLFLWHTDYTEGIDAFTGANNNLAEGEGINFSEKFCGGARHLNTSNSVATRQCIRELGIVLAASSFLLRGIPIGMKRKK